MFSSCFCVETRWPNLKFCENCSTAVHVFIVFSTNLRRPKQKHNKKKPHLSLIPSLRAYRFSCHQSSQRHCRRQLHCPSHTFYWNKTFDWNLKFEIIFFFILGTLVNILLIFTVVSSKVLYYILCSFWW